MKEGRFIVKLEFDRSYVPSASFEHIARWSLEHDTRGLLDSLEKEIGFKLLGITIELPVLEQN